MFTFLSVGEGETRRAVEHVCPAGERSETQVRGRTHQRGVRIPVRGDGQVSHRPRGELD